MARKAGINIRIGADLEDFSTAMQNVSRKMKRMGKKFQRMGKTMSRNVTLPILAIGAASIKFASDLQESVGKADVAFGQFSDTVKDFAKTTLTAFGIAEGTSLDMAANFGDMATSMGITQKGAASMSNTLVGLAGDLASFKNIGLDQAQTALAGIFTGETESLKKLGIVMTQANLQAFALTQGITKQVQKMTEAEKVTLRYSFILAKTANAQGDFERTGGNAAGQMRVFQETLKELAASFGEIILPAFTKILKKINGMLDVLRKLNPATKKIIIVVAAFAAAIGPLLIALGLLSTALAALAANPVVLSISLITLAIAAIGAAVTWVVGNFRKLVEEIKIGSARLQNRLLDVAKFLTTAFVRALQPIAKLFGVDLIEKTSAVFDSMRKEVPPMTKGWRSLKDILTGVSDEIRSGTNETNKFAKAVESAVEVGGGTSEGGAGGLSRNSGGIEMSSKGIKDFNIELEKTPSNLEKIGLRIMPIIDHVATLGEKLGELLTKDLAVNMLADSFSLLGESIGAAFAGADNAFDSFLSGFTTMVVGLLKEIGKIIIAYGAAAAAKGLLLGDASAIAGGLGFIALGTGIIGGASFAQNKIDVNLESRISGDDLVLSGNRTNKKNSRVR